MNIFSRPIHLSERRHYVTDWHTLIFSYRAAPLFVYCNRHSFFRSLLFPQKTVYARFAPIRAISKTNRKKQVFRDALMFFESHRPPKSVSDLAAFLFCSKSLIASAISAYLMCSRCILSSVLTTEMKIVSKPVPKDIKPSLKSQPPVKRVVCT